MFGNGTWDTSSHFSSQSWLRSVFWLALFQRYVALPSTSKAFPDLLLIEGTKIINPSVTAEDQTSDPLVHRTSVEFIKSHREDPFFLYAAHAMPHVPFFCSTEFQNSSEQGAYGDVIQEIDWGGPDLINVGRLWLTENTLVIYTSDNGPCSLMATTRAPQPGFGKGREQLGAVSASYA